MQLISARVITLTVISFLIIALLTGVVVSNDRPPVAQAPPISDNATNSGPSQVAQTQSQTSTQHTYAVTTTTAAAINMTALSQYGSIGTRVKNRIEVTTNPANKKAIENISWVSHVRPVIRAHTATTPGSSNGSSLGVTEIHDHGITGDGVRVGVIDIGFEPTNPTIRDNVVDTRSFVSGETSKRHGTSVAEIITQTAPKSDLYLASATTGVQMEAAFDYLQHKDVDIIVSSTGFLSPDDDGNHFLTDDVVEARQNGILFINSAGNLAQIHWEGSFRSTDGDDVHEWTQSGDERNCIQSCQSEYGGRLDIYIRWGAETDDSRYRAILYNPVKNETITAINAQRATESNRYAVISTRIDTQPVSLIIQHIAGPADDTIEVTVNSKTLSGMERNTPESSLIAPADVPETFTIAAYEKSVNRIAPYSSRGPTDVGLQGIDVTGYTNIDVENGIYGITPFRFTGTSASAPYVGGVAALVEGADTGDPSPESLATTLRSTSDDIQDPGDDTVSGSGVVNAVGAVESISSITITPTPTPTQTPSPTSTAAPTPIPTSTSTPKPTQTVTPTPTPSDDITIARSSSATEVTPGAKVTVTTRVTNASGSVSINANYTPPVHSAQITEVTVNGNTVSPIISEATIDGGVVVLDDLDASATVSVTEELTVSETAETTHIITGNVTTDNTTASADALDISVIIPDTPAERYDSNGDGNIDIIELGQAGKDFASGELTIAELGQVGRAFAS